MNLRSKSETIVSVAKSISTSNARWSFYVISLGIGFFLLMSGDHIGPAIGLISVTILLASPDILKLRSYLLPKSRRELEKKLKEVWSEKLKNLQKVLETKPSTPIFLLMGPSHSGKSSLLAEWMFTSISNGDTAEKYENQQIKAWHRKDSLTIEIPGRYLTEPTDFQEWILFLKFLKKYIKGNSIQGVLLALSVYHVLLSTPESLMPTLLESLKQLQKIMRFKGPISLMITKSDQLEGFCEFFKEEDIVESLMGVAYVKNQKTELACDFENLHQALFQRKLSHYDKEDKTISLKCVLFPEQFKKLTQQIMVFVKFYDIETNKNLFISGVYFMCTSKRDIIITTLNGKNSLRKTEETALDKRAFFSEGFIKQFLLSNGRQKNHKKSYDSWMILGGIVVGGLLMITFFSLQVIPKVKEAYGLHALTTNIHTLVQKEDSGKLKNDIAVENLLKEGQLLDSFSQGDKLNLSDKNESFILFELQKVLINYLELILSRPQNTPGEEKSLQMVLYNYLIKKGNEYGDINDFNGNAFLKSNCLHTNKKIEIAYSKKAYEKVILPELQKTKELFEIISRSNNRDISQWGKTPQEHSSAANVISTTLHNNYRVNYQRQWQEYLSSTYCTPLTSLQDASAQFSELSSQEGPLMELLNKYQENKLTKQGQLQSLPNVQPYLTALEKISRELAEINITDAPAQASFNYAVKILNGEAGSSALYEAYSQAQFYKSQIANSYEQEAVNTVLLAPLKSLWSLLLNLSLQQINTQWKESVYTYYLENLQNLFPFNSHGEDASLENFNQFFNPVNGLYASFMKKNLSGFVTMNNTHLQLKQWLDESLSLQPDTLKKLEWGLRVEQDLYSSNQLSLKINFYPHPSLGIQGSRITLGRQLIHYQNEPQRWQSVLWPSGQQENNASLVVTNVKGEVNVMAEIFGDWAIFHLFSQGRIMPLSQGNYKIEWPVKKNSQEDIIYQAAFKQGNFLEDLLLNPQGLPESL